LTAVQVSILVSCGALIVALVALWKTHFARFGAMTSAGRLQLRIYPIRNGDQRWFIASFDVPISVTNRGAQPGRVRGVRLALHFPRLPIPNNRELVSATWEIDPAHVRRINRERFRWLNELAVSQLTPFTVLAKQTAFRHLIFETRWEHPVVQQQVEVRLELSSESGNEWSQEASWSFGLTGATWTELVTRGTALNVLPEDGLHLAAACDPEDLHKYTGSVESIVNAPEQLEPSYLDYPQNLGDA